MQAFNYRDGILHAEGVSLTALAAEHGTPLYVYSRAAIERAFLNYKEALQDSKHLICYAVKANSNLAVLNILARLGAGFDVVSRGEIERVLAAGGQADRIVFSGVGKTTGEIDYALDLGIHCFNVESAAELEVLAQRAAAKHVKAPISLRVNPDVDANTHPYISTGLKENKFGVSMDEAVALYRRAAELEGLDIRGIDCHIGSQLTETAPFLAALDRLLALIDEIRADGITIEHIDMGGGLGVNYQGETPPTPQEYMGEILARLQGRDLTLMIEPGRSIVANAGILLTEVLYLKNNEAKHFAIVDAAMNDMIRPALYQAWVGVDRVIEQSDAECANYDIVGPVCETGDFLAKDRELALSAGDLLAVRSSGAYGFTMSSNYNTRARAAEIMVDGDKAHVIRQRESINSLFALESLLED
jgi:diaminopimelate decarboxylase